MASRNPKYPRPSIEEAVKIHNLAKELGQPIPHFFDDDGVLFYLDRTGKKAGGNQYFRNLGAKLSAEAKRKALKNKRTPTLDLYTRVYGEKIGTNLYKAEQANLKHIYTTTPTATHDVDHINSMASGGVHHSRNLRPQESALNRSEGARGLTPEAKNALMLADDVEDQIRLQGPPVISRIRDQIASNHMPRAFNRASVLKKLAPMVPIIGIGAGAADAAERTIKATETKDPIDSLQAGLSAAGTVPAVGNIADGANSLIDLTRWLSNPITRLQLDRGASRSFTGAHTGRY